MDAGRTSFIGRATELARLDAAVDVTRAGAFRLVVIGGEAGVGKTTLLDECLAGLNGERVLKGSCLPLERASVPYAPIVQALRTFIRSAEPSIVEAVFGPARQGLGSLLPELYRGRSDLARTPGTDPASQAYLFELVLGVLERLARRGLVVLAIEDLHWADGATRDLLGSLTRNLARSSVLILMTIRSDELTDDHPVLPLLSELERLDSAERIELDRFSRDEVAALLRSLTGTTPSAATLDRILSRSDGNPFFVEQLVADDAETDLPPRLGDILRTRIGRVSAASREVLRAAAAAGRPVDDGILAAVTGLAPRAVESALREAVSAKILVQASGPPVIDPGHSFRHALLQEVIYRELVPSERRRLHRAFATALQGPVEGVERRAPPPPSELAYHWELAGEWSAALVAHVDAGVAAVAVCAWLAAVHHFEHALAMLDHDPTSTLPDGVDRAELLHRAADAAFLAADYDRATAWGKEAIDLVEPVDPSRAGAYHVRMRWYLWDSGDRLGAAASVQESLRLIPSDPPSVDRAAALGQWAGVLMHTGRIEEAAEAASETLAIARSIGSRGEEAQALAMLGWIDVVVGRLEPGLAALHDAASIAEEIGDISGIALGHALIAHMEALIDRPAEARDAALAGYEAVMRRGAERTYGGVLLGHAAKALIALGDWTEADRIVEMGSHHELVGRPAHWLGIQRGRLATLRGRWDAAAQDLAAARAFENATGGSEYGDDLLAAEAELAAWRGDLAAARAVVDIAAARPPGAPLTPQIASLARFGLRAEADEAEHAREHHDAEREARARERGGAITGLWPPPAHVGGSTPTGLLMHAELARLDGHPDTVSLRTLVEACELAGRPFEAAEARYRLAGALLAVGESREEVRTLLRSALATCTALRAEVLRSAVIRLARRARLALTSDQADETVDGADRGGLYGRLTPREAQVLQLLAGGWTNRQIASELYISPRTASVHVTNIFGKLGANSRVEAAAIAHRHGLAGDAPLPPDAADLEGA